mmetsp:Transcript_26355/g.73650  ORF Transcript_26355/g.73650 Transcript_26355/m.73650 type:complete len:323 (-) Transcript_26355:277-1245(-)
MYASCWPSATRATMQPPQPAPVSLAPSAPLRLATATSSSSSGELHSYSSEHEACDSSISRPSSCNRPASSLRPSQTSLNCSTRWASRYTCWARCSSLKPPAFSASATDGVRLARAPMTSAMLKPRRPSTSSALYGASWSTSDTASRPPFLATSRGSTSLSVSFCMASSLGRPRRTAMSAEASMHSSTRRLYRPAAVSAFLLTESELATTKQHDGGSGTSWVLTGPNSMSLARPASPITLIAWSIPPDIVPTCCSHFLVNSATSGLENSTPWAAATASAEAHTKADDDERPDPAGTRPSTSTSSPRGAGASRPSSLSASKTPL